MTNQRASATIHEYKLIRNRLGAKLLFWLLASGFGLYLSIPRIFDLFNPSNDDGVPFLGMVLFVLGGGFAVQAWEVAKRKLREDWPMGRIRTANKLSLLGWWHLSALFILISLLSVPVAVRELNKENGFLYHLLIAPLIGFGVLVGTVHHTLQYRKFGESCFKMSPLLIDDQLKGMIETSIKLPDTNFKLKLSCTNRVVTGTLWNRTTNDRLLWKYTIQNIQQLPDVEESYSLIPVRIPVPYKWPDTKLWDSQDQIIWLLEVSTELPGINYSASFEIPIFRGDPKTVVPKKSRRSREKRR